VLEAEAAVARILFSLALVEQEPFSLVFSSISRLELASESSLVVAAGIICVHLAHLVARSCMAIALTVPQTTRLDQEA
jgi:hypothetical protein